MKVIPKEKINWEKWGKSTNKTFPRAFYTNGEKVGYIFFRSQLYLSQTEYGMKKIFDNSDFTNCERNHRRLL